MQLNEKLTLFFGTLVIYLFFINLVFYQDVNLQNI